MDVRWQGWTRSGGGSGHHGPASSCSGTRRPQPRPQGFGVRVCFSRSGPLLLVRPIPFDGPEDESTRLINSTGQASPRIVRMPIARRSGRNCTEPTKRKETKRRRTREASKRPILLIFLSFEYGKMAQIPNLENAPLNLNSLRSAHILYSFLPSRSTWLPSVFRSESRVFSSLRR